MKKAVKKRMVSQDIAKGLAILLVVFVHSVKVNKGIGSVIGVLFGYIMPFFLFISGYNYNDKGQGIANNLKRRLKQLLIPFIIISFLIFTIMGTYFVLMGEGSISDVVKSFLIFLSSKWALPYFGLEFNQVLFQRILGPCWFIQFLIVADIIFIPAQQFAKDDDKILFLLCFTFTILSAVLIHFRIYLPWGIQNAPAIACSMLIANKLKNIDGLFSDTIKKKWTIVNCVICIITIAVIQLCFNGAGYFGAGDLGGVLGGVEVLVYYLISLFGTYFIVNFCKLIEKTVIIKDFFCFFGQHSFIILMVHMSIVHILKNIFSLPQWNAADGLFGRSTNFFAEFIVASLTVMFVSFISKILGNFLNNIMNKNN